MTDFSSKREVLTSPDELVLQQRRQLRETIRSFRQAQILLTCVELGVFEALATGPADAVAVAVAAGADRRGMELLLNAAAALGFLEKRGALFANSPLAEAGSDMANSLRLEGAFYRRWGHLADAVRTGQRPEDNRRDEQPDDWVYHFVHALYNMARPVAPFIAEALALPEEQPLRLLDVGGGHGGYSLALARRYPLLTATVFELPRVVPVAREIIEQAGLSDRVAVQEGDFQREELGQGYDVALVFGVLNGEPPEGRLALIRKVFAALNPGGQIILRDFVLDPDRAGPPEAAVFALQMLLATDAGGLDTSEDWARWLVEAGFNPPHMIDLPDWVSSPLAAAVKPVT